MQNFNEWGDPGDLLPTLPQENKCRNGFFVLGKYSVIDFGFFRINTEIVF